MSDLFKSFSFDLQRFALEIEGPIVGQSGLTAEIEFEEIGDASNVVMFNDVVNSSDSSFDGQYFWDESAEDFANSLDFGSTSGVQLQIKYDAYQVTGLSTGGSSSTDVYTIYKITGINAIDFEGSYSVITGRQYPTQ